jgi:small subunit ribosomal protein S16
MVRIRLRRVGARNQPSYRIVVADQRKPRDGRFLEILGHYNPRTEPATVNVDEARLFYWLKNGAQASDSVRRLLDTYGTWDRWERYQAGEDLRALLQETEANVLEVDPRTRRDDLAGKRPKRAQEVAFSAQELLEREAAEAPAGEGEAEREPTWEAEEAEPPSEAAEEVAAAEEGEADTEQEAGVQAADEELEAEEPGEAEPSE